ncbi:hypothetical protein [Dyadobacter frigoris]|uniref:hypothetical protein n=1 Tax=Dyadobacter frigoris TaxID=2576211 RepID=UPI0025554FD8|nr:hypothetical protein [Dyadobacter frigoris]
MKTSETNLTNPAGAGLVERVWDDPRLRAVHICLYAAIAFHCVKASQNQIQISRRKLMRYARIKSIATYHSCIRDLARFGHIDYHPSFHPLRASRIVLSGQDRKSLKKKDHG